MGDCKEIVLFVKGFFVYIVPLGSTHWHRYVCWFFVILYLSVVSFMQWSIIECKGYFTGLFFMYAGVAGCVGCGGVGGECGFRCLMLLYYVPL